MLAVGIDIVDVFKGYLLPDRRQLDSAFPVIVRLVVDKEKDPSKGCYFGLQADPVDADFDCAAHEAKEDAKEHAEVARRHDIFDDPVSNGEGDIDRTDYGSNRPQCKQQNPHQHGDPFSLIGFGAAFCKPLFFPLHAPQALHRADVAHGLFHGIGSGRAGRALGLMDAAQQTRGRVGNDKCHGQHGPGHPYDFRRHRAIGILHQIHVDQCAENRRKRQDRQIVAGMGYNRRIVEHAIYRVADALVVQSSHRQTGQPLKQAGAQLVGDALAHTNVNPVFDKTPDAAGTAVSLAYFVLRLNSLIASSKWICPK